MNSTQKKQAPVGAAIILVSVLALSSAPIAVAQEVVACGANAVDYDNDGWGWENEASCRMPVEQAPELPSGTVYCISSDADVDGDGWGWENNNSCVVNPTFGNGSTGGSGNGPLQGNDFSTAAAVTLNSSVSASIIGVDTHYYKFEITELMPVTVRVQTADQYGAYLDLSVLDTATNETVLLQPSYDSSNSAARCMEPGSYYLTVVQSYVDSGSATDYTLNVNSSTARCATPISRYSSDGYYNQTVISSDGIVYSHNPGYDINGNYDSRGEVLTARDLSGVVLWESSIEGVGEIATDELGNIAVSTYSGIALLSSDGQTIWESDAFDYPYNMVIGESAIVFQTSYAAISAVNVSDGQEKWIFNDDEYIDSFKLLDDGRVAVKTSDEIVVLAQ